MTRNSEVAGPHVIVPTDEVVHVNDRANGFRGEVKKWRCKYCGKTGTHPDGPSHNMKWCEACEEFEPLESEKEGLR